MQIKDNLPNISGTVLWLIPVAEHSAAFQKEISRLSNRYNTTTFTPHLTLGRLPNRSSEEALISLKAHLDTKVLAGLSAGSGSIVCSDSPYQNLVLELKNSASLKRLQMEIESCIPGYHQKEEYHVSLMYGNVPCDELQKERAESSDRLPGRVRFSRISAIELNGTPESWRSVWTLDLI